MALLAFCTQADECRSYRQTGHPTRPERVMSLVFKAGRYNAAGPQTSTIHAGKDGRSAKTPLRFCVPDYLPI